MSEIKCKVHECYFNDDSKCVAEGVLIAYDQGCTEVECCSNTACETFRKA